ncbi:hypothetical protein KXV85_005807, partial [Aspergillus fumigatus]
LQRLFQRRIVDPALLQRLPVEGPRHQDPRPHHAFERRRGGGEALTRETEERIDRNEMLERPERRDARAGGRDAGLERDVRVDICRVHRSGEGGCQHQAIGERIEVEPVAQMHIGGDPERRVGAAHHL